MQIFFSLYRKNEESLNKRCCRSQFWHSASPLLFVFHALSKLKLTKGLIIDVLSSNCLNLHKDKKFRHYLAGGDEDKLAIAPLFSSFFDISRLFLKLNFRTKSSLANERLFQGFETLCTL